MEQPHQPYTLTAAERAHYLKLVQDWDTLCSRRQEAGTPIAWDDLTPALQHEVNIRGARQLCEGERPISTVGGVVGALVNEVFVPLLHGLTGQEFIDDGVVDSR